MNTPTTPAKFTPEWFRYIAAKGGAARARNLSPKRRSQIARKAVKAREAKRKKANAAAPAP